MKEHKYRSFKSRIYRWIILIYLAVLVFSAVVICGIAIPNLQQSKVFSEQETVRQATRRLEDQLVRLNAMGIQAAYNASIRATLEKCYDGNMHGFMDYTQDEENVFRYFQDASRTMDGVVGVYIYNSTGYMYFYSSLVTVSADIRAQAMDWYSHMMEHKNPQYTYFTNLRHPPQIPNSSQYTVSLVRNLRNVGNFQYYGQVEVQLLPQAFHAVLQDYDAGETQSNRKVTLLDREGRVIYSSGSHYATGDYYRKDVLDRVHIMENDRAQYLLENDFISIRRVDSTGWLLAVETNNSYIMDDIIILTRLLLIFAGIAGALVLILGALTANELTKPILELKNKIHDMEQGNFDTVVQTFHSWEFNSLAQSFDELSTKLKGYIVRIRVAERERRETEIMALQSQINPHFTLNTLNTIKYLATLQSADNVVAMLDDFTLLLQVALSSPTSLVTVEEELMRIQAFFRIQEISSFGKIQLSIDAEPQVRRYYTMNMLLQPLVENAIFHGIKPKMERHQLTAGMICIRATLADHGVVIHVTDDGVGMSQEAADKLPLNAQAGIGVYNVSRRIRLRFGEPYGLSIKSGIGEGCDITLLLPIINSAESAQAYHIE